MNEWMLQGLCAQTDPEIFFPEHGQTSRLARQVCSRCPVRVECLKYALEDLSLRGVWGGTNEEERRLIRRTAA